MIGIRRFFLLIVAVMAAVSVSAAKNVTFTAQAPKAVVIGDNFRLTYSVDVSNAKKLRIPSIDEGFEVLAGPSTSTRSSTTIVNGKIESSSTVTYTYVLVGTAEGEYTIPGATIEVGGESYTSNSVKIKVLPQDSQAAAQGQSQQSGQQQRSQQQSASRPSGNGNISNSDLFMRAIVNKTTAYEQEAILLTFKVYSLVDLRSLSNKMPDLKNFHVQEIELPQNKEFELEHYNGRNYQTLVWSQYVLFPQQSGELEIPSTSFDAVIVQAIQSDDIFDMFFNGGRYVETNKTLATNPLKINVKALPTGRTEAFSGGVGDFSISSNINTENPSANDAVTVQIVVSGTGNMKLIKTPELKYPQDFDIYDPKVENKFTLKTNGQTGNKVFEYLAIPRHAGEYTIPAVEFQYFDVKSGKYKTLKTDEYHLNVSKGEGSETASAQAVASYVSKEDLKYVGQDARFHTTSPKLLHSDNVFFGSSLYWVLMVIPVIILIIILLLSKKHHQDNANTIQTKRKKANSQAVRRLKKARKLMEAGNKDDFYDEVLRALWGYVSDKLAIPIAELNKDNIASELRSKAVSEELIDQVTGLIGNCEFARYAPGDESGKMDSIYNDAVNVIGQMDNSIKR